MRHESAVHYNSVTLLKLIKYNTLICTSDAHYRRGEGGCALPKHIIYQGQTRLYMKLAHFTWEQ